MGCLFSQRFGVILIEGKHFEWAQFVCHGVGPVFIIIINSLWRQYLRCYHSLTLWVVFLCVCGVGEDSVILPLISYTLFLLLSLTLVFFPLSMSGTPTEIPSRSESEEVLPGINTHSHTEKQAHAPASSSNLAPLIRPPTDILFVSCCSSAPSHEHKSGRRGVNTSTFCEEEEDGEEAQRAQFLSVPVIWVFCSFLSLCSSGFFPSFYIWTCWFCGPNSVTVNFNRDLGPHQSYYSSSGLRALEWEKPCWFFFFCNQFPLSLPAAVGISSQSCLLIRRAVYPIHFTHLPISIISILACPLLPSLLCLPSLYPWLIHYIF